MPLWMLCGLAALMTFAFASAANVADLGGKEAVAETVSGEGAISPAPDAIDFDIPAQPLAAALNRYAFLTKRPAMYPSEMSTGRASSAVRGRYTPEAALQQLLAGTGLTAEKMHTGAGDTFVLIEAGKSADADAATAAQARGEMAALLGSRAGYSGLVQSRIWQALCADAGTVPGNYSSLLRFRIDADGGIGDARLLDSSGDVLRDAALLAAVRGVHIGWPPPPGLAQQALTMAILPGAAAPSCPTENGGG